MNGTPYTIRSTFINTSYSNSETVMQEEYKFQTYLTFYPMINESPRDLPHRGMADRFPAHSRAPAERRMQDLVLFITHGEKFPGNSVGFNEKPGPCGPVNERGRSSYGSNS